MPADTMKARDIMMGDVLTVAAEASLLDAAKIMINGDVSGLPVTDAAGRMVGLLSEVDVIREATGGTPTLASSVESAMTRDVITATEDAAVEDVAALMLQHKVKRIPIVRGGAVVGIVSRLDLVKAMLAEASGGASTDAAPADDETLRERVTLEIRRLGVPVRGGFDVIVQNGIVHLWGEAADQAGYTACIAAAAKVPGVRDVLSHMQVRSALRRSGPYSR
jgi:CBS domain-containing protein